jgi:hypothetical protein
LANSMEKEVGSVVLAVHVTVTVAPVVQPEMDSKVKAETRGRARASVQSLANILERAGGSKRGLVRV